MGHEEIARNLMILLEKNVCICDCLGCKTSSCLNCSANNTPPWKRWDMCFENDGNSFRDILEALDTKDTEADKLREELAVLRSELRRCGEALKRIKCMPRHRNYEEISEVASKALSSPILKAVMEEK